MSGLESGIEGNSATADTQVVGSVATSHHRNVEAIPYWWGFKLTLSTLAVDTLHDRTEEIVSVLAQFLPHPLSVISSLVVVPKQSTYKALSGPAGVVIASPWPMPLMLSQVREASAESNMMAWIAFAHGTWSPVARIADDYLKNTRPAISAYKIAFTYSIETPRAKYTTCYTIPIWAGGHHAIPSSNALAVTKLLPVNITAPCTLYAEGI